MCRDDFWGLSVKDNSSRRSAIAGQGQGAVLMMQVVLPCKASVPVAPNENPPRPLPPSQSLSIRIKTYKERDCGQNRLQRRQMWNGKMLISGLMKLGQDKLCNLLVWESKDVSQWNFLNQLCLKRIIKNEYVIAEKYYIISVTKGGRK